MKTLKYYLDPPVKLALLITLFLTMTIGGMFLFYNLSLLIALPLYGFLVAGYLTPWLWLWGWMKNKYKAQLIWLLCQSAWVVPVFCVLVGYFIQFPEYDYVWWVPILTVVTVFGWQLAVVGSFFKLEQGT